MTDLQAIVLGLVQGLTEFLPVSSSGHLVIFQHFFGLKDPILFFDITLHFGTMCSIILIYRKEIFEILKSTISIKDGFSKALLDDNFKFMSLIIVASIPTAIIGFLLKKNVEAYLSSINVVILMLLITSLFLWLSKGIKKDGITIQKITFKIAIIIGIVQGFAVFPGISRSGSTIVCALLLGMNKKTAAKFSFLLALPVILGAEILSISDLTGQDMISLNNVILGTLTSFIIGLIALKLTIKAVEKGKLYYFAPYCFIFAICALILK